MPANFVESGSVANIGRTVKEFLVAVGFVKKLLIRCLVVGDDRLNVIEFSAIDLFKAVGQRISGTLTLPDEATYVAFEDLDINFPLLLFKGAAARDDAIQAFHCLTDLCHRFVANGVQRFITASIGLRYDKVVVIFSFAGFASSLLDVFDGGLDEFPPTFDDVGSWCANCQSIQKMVAGESQLTSDMLDMLKSTGCFSFARPFGITKEIISINRDGSAVVRLPKQEKTVACALHDGTLKIAPVYLIKRCQCEKCGASYFDCQCSAFMEEACSVSVTECEPLGFFLTERRA